MRTDPETYAVIGTAMEVHRELGHGFLEAVYQEALAREMTLRKIPFAREVPIDVLYKGSPLPCAYRADFVCFDSILIEVKAKDSLCDSDKAQVINYLNATRFTRALLFNFGSRSLEYQRLVLNHPDHKAADPKFRSSVPKA
jgi:GxxExxY protein